MFRKLMIVVASAVLLLTSLGGHAVAQGANTAPNQCIPEVDGSACIPPNPV
jgi:hypothetical protein